MITKDNFKNVLLSLGFTSDDEIYFSKVYDNDTSDEFKLHVDFQNNKFEYPPELNKDRNTTLNFHQNESFVVFECLVRLFDVGYKPNNIVLEGKNYEGQSLGWIDILVRDNEKTEYLIIECKTSNDGSKGDDEFSKYWKRTLRNGDQLFRYFNTFSKARFLCLYTADFIDGELKDTYYLITLADNKEYLESNKKLSSYEALRGKQGSYEEFYKVWKDTYHLDYSTNGLIEKDSKPFDIGKKKVSIDDLKEIDSVSMQKKYNEFAEILRKYNVSSKENAFDKLVNLFLAKIVDETNNKNELKCLWKGAAYDSYYALQDRLQSLYKIGMKDFFKDDVAYIENSQIDEAFKFLKSKSDEAKDTIKRYFYTLKYYNNNPFAFLEVHNETLFNQNAVILKDVVKMIQDIKIKTETQNQFLGDLFEGFLDQGFKQDEGQFFTPIPIVKFLISSLPLDMIIRDSEDIPKVIDFACGAGHFLTEYAQQIKPFVEKYQKADINQYFQNICGIEKENRLSKVSQVSAFMYGLDGISILYQDGLAKSDEVKEGTYSVLVANPPYSVKGFLGTLSDEDRKQYDLFSDGLNVASNNSIETFFVERAKQLLKADGVAAIILPSSILSNGNIYSRCREIILKYFDIAAIFESGSGTFGKTGTNTVTLFLRRRKDEPSLSSHLMNRVEAWFSGNFEDDGAYEDSSLLERYCAFQKVDADVYRSLLSGCSSSELFDSLNEIELFNEYISKFTSNDRNAMTEVNGAAKRIRGEFRSFCTKPAFKRLSEEEKSLKTISATLSFIREIEKEKLYFFMLADSNAFDVLVVKSPNSSSEIKNFLGYEWSSTKGNEGIKYKNVQRVSSEDGDSGTDDTIEQVKGIDGIKTPLFNPQDLNDESKINVLIRKTFEGIGFDIPEELQKYVQRYSLPDLMDFSRIAFDKAIKTTAATKAIEIESKFPLIKLRDVCDIEYGTRITKKDVLGDEYPVYGGGGETFKSEKFNRENCYIISRFGMSAECVRFVKGKFFLNDSGLSLSKKNLENNELDINYINLLLLVNQNIIYSLGRGSSQKNLDMAAFSSIKIPHPPLDVQKKIVAECEAIDSDVEKATAEIDMDKYEIEKIIERVHASSYDVKELSKIIKDTEYGTSKKSQQSGKVPVIRMGNIQDGQIDMSDLVFTDDEDDITKLKLNKFDILFNRTNSPEHVGKVGIYMDDGPAIFAGYLIRINYLPEVINPIYLCYIMNSRKIREYGFSIMSKSINQANISGNALVKYKIPVPSLPEQQKIVAEIEAIEKRIDANKEIIEAAAAKKKAVLDTWLK